MDQAMDKDRACPPKPTRKKARPVPREMWRRRQDQYGVKKAWRRQDRHQRGRGGGQSRKIEERGS